MTFGIHRRGGFPALAALAVVALAATACGGSSGGSTNNAGGGTSASPVAGCEDFAQYGNLKGKTVTVYTGIVTPEDQLLKDTWAPFEKCTGATIKGEFDKSFEAQILVRAKAGNLPDIGIVPQPGLLKALIATGKAVPADQATIDAVDKNFAPSWKDLGSADGKFYAPPQNANIKSFVWYSPKEFTSKGYTIPKTLDELKALSDKIAATGKKPWCAGISSGEATGWPVTDWMEDWMLRLYGADEYDKWVNHSIAFNSEEPTAALDAVGAYLKNSKYVNGGLGDVKSIASTTFQDAGTPILKGQCSMHRQASFYAANWPKTAKVAPDGDIFAFYLPGVKAEDKPVLGGGEFMLGFRDAPEVHAFQAYVSSTTWANLSEQGGGGRCVTPNKNADPAKAASCSDIDKLSISILQDPKAVFRFDGSDAMPSAVGTNSFWKQATAWITGQSTKDTVDKIEASWPK
ncbi:MAG: alpha-glucoside transport system substrate-binding protein [Actinomycetota bacterium]|jgi:alpha-glucoside transport system substrate-binding protein|nr:alpha-glucoside transport system substrate-binding protein [Actinomycetota bacterium]